MTRTLGATYYTQAGLRVADWCGVVDFPPETYHAPDHADDLHDILAAALAVNRSIRVLGGLHSCSEIFEHESVVDLSRLPLAFDVAPTPNPDGTTRVVASAFMHVHDFNERAAAAGLSLTALGGTDAQTLAGLIATNTAGATIFASVYETLAWVEFLTVGDDGKSIGSRTVARGDPDFPGMVASLGAIGLMTRVGFDLVPQQFFTAGETLMPVADILADLDKTNAAYRFWRIEWLPGDLPLGNFWWANPVTGPGDPNGDYGADQVVGAVRAIVGFDEHLFKSGGLTDPVLQAAYGMMVEGYKPMNAAGPLRNMIPVDRNAQIKVAMAEWSIAPSQLWATMAACRAYFATAGWPNLSIEIQCTRKDDFWMSAWNWPDVPQDYIVKLNFQYITDFLDPDEKLAMMTHLRGLWDALGAAGIVLKAHWGKLNFLDTATVAARYQPDPFRKLVKPLFLNDYVRQRVPL